MACDATVLCGCDAIAFSALASPLLPPLLLLLLLLLLLRCYCSRSPLKVLQVLGQLLASEAEGPSANAVSALTIPLMLLCWCTFEGAWPRPGFAGVESAAGIRG
jgi:hypothetical protein